MKSLGSEWCHIMGVPKYGDLRWDWFELRANIELDLPKCLIWLGQYRKGFNLSKQAHLTWLVTRPKGDSLQNWSWEEIRQRQANTSGITKIWIGVLTDLLGTIQYTVFTAIYGFRELFTRTSGETKVEAKVKFYIWQFSSCLVYTTFSAFNCFAFSGCDSCSWSPLFL